MSLADVRTWGGPRRNSGRKAALRPKVRHRTRPAHYSDCPVHVTMRRAKGLPSFRSERLRRLLEQAIRDTRCEGFRIVEYSVQADHLHILIEADDPTALTSGMRSFSVRVAMRVNARILNRRRGHVWGDRYHRRELGTPSEVRRALVYVLDNHLKHGEWMHHRDPRPPDPSPAQPPKTWLLEKGWSTLGLGFLHLGEVPSALTK